jgi:hypothetical protein
MVKRAAPFALLLALACGPVKGPLVVEALVPDGTSAKMADIELTTVTDLSTGEGELFDVRSGMVLNEGDFLAAMREGASYDDIVTRVRGGRGQGVSPRMSFDGTRWVAQDFDTLFYFTVFANFEQSWLYYRDVVGDESAATSERSLVGMYAELESQLLSVPLLTSDNAAYAAPFDGWLTLRVGVQDGVPFAMHKGVIGHEFQHRVFFQNMFGAEGFDVWARRFDETPEADLVRSTVLMNGCDEGLADLFAIGLNENVHAIDEGFAAAGFLFASAAESRDLEGSFASGATFEALDQGTLPSELVSACFASGEGGTIDTLGFNFYCIGTVLARALWDGTDRDIGVLRDDLLPAVNRALRALGAVMRSGSLFQIELLLEAIATELPAGDLRDGVCGAFNEKFSSLMPQVPTCF